MRGPSSILAAFALVACAAAASAQQPNVTLHVNTKWRSCAIQLDPALTQSAWHQFTEEAGVLTYFRPLTDARPMGRKNFEFSILQQQTKVDETTSAWNDTFVHPDSMHWLTDGAALGIPGLQLRGGVTDRIDVGAYFTKNTQSNYGVWGGQIQYNITNNQAKRFAASTRFSFVSLYGPADVDLNVYGLDLVASKTAPVSNRLFVSPYAALSGLMSHSHENAAAVTLNDETTWGVMGTIGAMAQFSAARLGVEYNVAKVSAFSFKLGVGF